MSDKSPTPLSDRTLLVVAMQALRSYQHGNGATDLARCVADIIEGHLVEAFETKKGDPDDLTTREGLRNAVQPILDEIDAGEAVFSQCREHIEVRFKDFEIRILLAWEDIKAGRHVGILTRELRRVGEYVAYNKANRPTP